MTREFKKMLSGWGIVGQTHEIAALVGELRANEERLRRRWQDLAPGEAIGLYPSTLFLYVSRDCSQEGFQNVTPVFNTCPRFLVQ